MAVYFIPKSRLFSAHLPSSNFIQNKWTSRWITISTSSSSSSTSSKQSNQLISNCGKSNRRHSSKQYSTETASQHQNSSSSSSTKKGKFNKLKKIRKSWNWKAGAGWTILSVLDWWLLAAGGWLTWRGLLLKWTPIGIGIATIVHWHLHNRRCDQSGLPRTASKWVTAVYCSLPLRLMSRSWGWIADRQIPIPVRPMVYGAYSTVYGVNIQEATNSDFRDYRSIKEFFTRSLKPEVRPICKLSSLVSPADGRVLHFGLAEGEHIEQVKGINYSLEAFIGPPNWKDPTVKELNPYSDVIRQNRTTDTALYQCVIYLAPGDYHRFHSPTEWQPEVRRHFHGELLSVSPRIARWLPELFCLNERALYLGRWEYGFFSFTAVGATNVGSVDVFIDENLKTNRWSGFRIGKINRTNQFDEVTLSPSLKLNKGELLGQFNMGSTIVLVFEAPKTFRFFIEPGQQVRLGQPIGSVQDVECVKNGCCKCNTTEIIAPPPPPTLIDTPIPTLVVTPTPTIVPTPTEVIEPVPVIVGATDTVVSS